MMRTYCEGKHRSFLFGSTKIRLEVGADKTKYMVMSRDQNVDEVTHKG